MFGRSMFDDPFFEDTVGGGRMRQPFGMMDPFGMMGGHPALTGPRQDGNNTSNAVGRRNNNMLLPFGGFGGGSLFDSMFADFGQMANNPNAHSYSSSTMMSFTSDGMGQPRVYQASQSTRVAPGGIKETQKQVRDSATGMQKMSIDHQIGDRSHTIEKSFNARTNEETEMHNIVNMDEDETDQFESEWQQRTVPYNSRAGNMLGGPRYSLPSERLALPYDVNPQRERHERHRHHHHHSTHHHQPYHSNLYEHDDDDDVISNCADATSRTHPTDRGSMHKNVVTIPDDGEDISSHRPKKSTTKHHGSSKSSRKEKSSHSRHAHFSKSDGDADKGSMF